MFYVSFYVCFRSPPPVEHAAISTHLDNLLHCRLDQLPVEVLTDYFIVSPGMASILPKKLSKSYVPCLKRKQKREVKGTKEHRTIISGYLCNTLLNDSCTYGDGVNELKYYEKLHGPVQKNYDVSVQTELKKSNYSFKTKGGPKHQQCLQEVSRNLQPCLQELIEECKTSTIRATKVIRFFLETAEHLLKKDPYIKFIYYIRDPRGVIESRFRRTKLDLKKDKTIAQIAGSAMLLCSKMKADYAVFKRLAATTVNNFMLLKYEDLVKNKDEVLVSAYNFIGQNIPATVLDFFKNATSASKDGSAMQTSRKNGTSTSSLWQKKLPSQIISMIQTICASSLQSFNYPIL